MPINWTDQAVKDRLLAAIIGSFPGTINCGEVARLYGPEASYHAIENFLRKPKKKAMELRADAEARHGVSAPASPARPRAAAPKQPKTPTKGDTVKTGRIVKSSKKNSSPLKASFTAPLDDTPQTLAFGGFSNGSDLFASQGKQSFSDVDYMAEIDNDISV